MQAKKYPVSWFFKPSKSQSSSSEDKDRDESRRRRRLSWDLSGKKKITKSSSLDGSSDNDLPYSDDQKMRYINIIDNEHQNNTYKKCVKLSNGLVYIDEKTEHHIFAITNSTRSEIPFDIYFLDRLNSLGEGANSVIYPAYHLQTDEKVAAKVSKEGAFLEDFTREVTGLKKMNRLWGSCTFIMATDMGASEKQLILMNYYPGKDLQSFLYKVDHSFDSESVHYFREKRSLNMLLKLKIIILLLKEMADIHASGLLHRDIKAQNVQINDSDVNHLKLNIIDFGSSISAHDERYDYIGTPGYIAPEVTLSNRPCYAQSADWYSLGVLIAEVLTQYSFQGEIRRIRAAHLKKSHFLTEISVSEIHTAMPDVFLSTPKSSFRLNHETKIKEYIFEALQTLVRALTHKNPKKRLKDSSLEQEIEKLEKLLKKVEAEEVFANDNQSTEKKTSAPLKIIPAMFATSANDETLSRHLTYESFKNSEDFTGSYHKSPH